jgi:muramidase (phage lysozyme)
MNFIVKSSWRKVSPRRWLRALRRFSRKKPVAAIVLVVALILIAIGTMQRSLMPARIDPAAYTPLLDTIAKGESKGNYNAYYGKATNKKVRFTEMSVDEVLKWQENYVSKGSPSSAVGKYQIIRPTLLGLVKELKLDTRVRFDEKLQDKLAITLLERRGAHAFVQKKLTREQFAGNLAKEWAALPKVAGTNPEESYYANDGINKAQISIDEIYQALTTLEAATIAKNLGT